MVLGIDPNTNFVYSLKKTCRRAGFLAFIFDPEGTIKKSKTLSPWLKKIEHII